MGKDMKTCFRLFSTKLGCSELISRKKFLGCFQVNWVIFIIISKITTGYFFSSLFATKLGCFQLHLTEKKVFPFLLLYQAVFSFFAPKSRFSLLLLNRAIFSFLSPKTCFLCLQLNWAVFHPSKNVFFLLLNDASLSFFAANKGLLPVWSRLQYFELYVSRNNVFPSCCEVKIFLAFSHQK